MVAKWRARKSRKIEVAIDPVRADFLDGLAYALPQYFAQIYQKSGRVDSQRRSIGISVIFAGQDEVRSLAPFLFY
jgi:hypothetical protein